MSRGLTRIIFQNSNQLKMMSTSLKSKLLLKKLLGFEINSKVELNCTHQHIHDWCICPIGITSESNILSLGIGNDISFDKGIINNYNCTVYAFDPTPRWIEWIKTQEVPEKFHFFPYAISAQNGTIKLYPRMPKGKPSSTMLTLVNEGENNNDGIVVTTKNIKTITSDLNISKIDILKMDIEAAEYEVIDNFLTDNVPVYQLLVEFHHRFKSVNIKQTKNSIKKLFDAGYRIFYISKKAREYSFIHEKTYKELCKTTINS